MLGLVNTVKMRKSKLTAEEIEAAELAADNRKKSRRDGFSLMAVRDRGIAELSNGIVVRWPHKTKWSDEINGISTRETSIPEGTFMIDNKLYDVDELQRFLRWV